MNFSELEDKIKELLDSYEVHDDIMKELLDYVENFGLERYWDGLDDGKIVMESD